MMEATNKEYKTGDLISRVGTVREIETGRLIEITDDMVGYPFGELEMFKRGHYIYVKVD